MVPNQKDCGDSGSIQEVLRRGLGVFSVTLEGWMETHERTKVGLCWAADKDVGRAWVQGAEPGVDRGSEGAGDKCVTP